MTETETQSPIQITLTGEPPVQIREDAWPLLATDGGAGDTANSHGSRAWERTIKVRQHADGRAIIYGLYNTTSDAETEGVSARRGILLPAGTTVAMIIDAIHIIGTELAAAEAIAVGGRLHPRWHAAIHETIAALPPVVLS